MLGNTDHFGTIAFGIILLLFIHVHVIHCFNPCESEPCQNDGTCIMDTQTVSWDGFASGSRSNNLGYHCVCKNGWRGVNCTEDVDDCLTQPCLNGGSCEDLPNMRYICHCTKDFVGRNCEFANVCAENPCSNGGRCEADSLGGFTCHCPKWYQGKRCELELNPCFPRNPCVGPSSTCSVIQSDLPAPASLIGEVSTITFKIIVDFQCTCGPGFTGRYCDIQLDLCSPNPCLNGASCVDRSTSVLCICPAGYNGSRCELQIPSGTLLSSPEPTTLSKREPISISTQHQDVAKEMSTEEARCIAAGCPSTLYGDGECQVNCFLQDCGGQAEKQDCNAWLSCLSNQTASAQHVFSSCVSKFQDGHCDEQCNTAACHFDGFDCLQDLEKCPEWNYCKTRYGDGVCDGVCSIGACGFDGGDCTGLRQSNMPRLMSRVRIPQWNETKPNLNLLILNTTIEQFAPHRQEFFAALGMLLQSVVKIWKDPKTGTELIVDSPSAGGMKVIVASWSNVQICIGAQCLTNPISGLSDLKIADYIQAGLSTPQYHSPVALKQIAPIRDPVQSDFFAEPKMPSSGFVRSGEAIGLYVCLCVFAAMLILLLLFVVLQRESWKRTARKVRTNGIWCPPVSTGPKDDSRMVSCGKSSEHQFSPSKLHQPLLQSFFATPNSNLRDTAKTNEPLTILLDTFDEPLEKPPVGDSAERQSTQEFLGSYPTQFDPSLDSVLSSSVFLLDELPDTKNFGQSLAESGNCKSEDNYRMCLSGSQQGVKVDHGPSLHTENTSQPKREYLESNKQKTQWIEDQLSRLVKSQDGLHPPNSSSLAALGHSTQSYPQISRGSKQAEITTSKYSGPAMVAEHSRQFNGLSREDDYEEFPEETLFHLAGRFNGGQDVVFAIPHLLCMEGTEKVSECILGSDRNGRTPLTTAAAANALETAGALYQLERETLISSKACHVNRPSNSVAAEPGKPRRRQKPLETRQPNPLITAVQAGNEELVKYLIDEGYPLTGLDEYGRNVVHWAATLNSLSLLQRFSQCKGFQRLMNARDDCDRTPLMLATREGCVESVRFLLDHKCNIFNVDCTDSDPLKMAQEKGFNTIERLLLEHYTRETNEFTQLNRAPHLMGSAGSPQEHSCTERASDVTSDSNNHSVKDVYTRCNQREYGLT
ncbi:hypothetical protein PHET_01936 [Paragonimus heterotremus]|uniref:Uncharacterized protein n=1 Tax=Paragonimus heterotremus TaxID=100268 RepID=A0A8J4T2S8_9TREM|nr:hypothetical protein PHET_01936 [Paragonimus heterotremus]